MKALILYLGGAGMLFSGVLANIDSFVAVGLGLLFMGTAELAGDKLTRERPEHENLPK